MLNTVAQHRRGRVVVVGAGMGGLVSAALLAAGGLDVTVVEKESWCGGKIRTIEARGRMIDSGPTVFTMRWVFEAIFAAAGARLDDHLSLRRADILARHWWEDGSVLDLHADPRRSAEAIAQMCGAEEARRFEAFGRRTREVFRTLDLPFMQNPSPSPIGLAKGAGLGGLAALARIRPFSSLWNVLGEYFHDPRLRQLFGRYATYCGSSPFDAPGPLMLISEVEQMGVWLVEGGMSRIPEAIASLGELCGATYRYDAEAADIRVENGRASAVVLADGQVLQADAVVFNGDPCALAAGQLGEASRMAVAGWPAQQRSLSALTWSISARTYGFALSRHTVFFSRDYRREFADLFEHRRLPGDPTIYVCAQDRDGAAYSPPDGEERLFILVNAPPTGDHQPPSQQEIEACETRVMERLRQAGLAISAEGQPALTGPRDFARLFPGTGGALYGRRSHGWTASFQRPLARTKISGLYLAGGGVHPGAGIPMAALSGRHAAAAVLSDLASTGRFRPAATAGGMSTRSATTAATR